MSFSLGSDTFNRADGSIGTADSGQTWTVHGGTWNIASNRIVAPSAAAYNAVSIDVGPTDALLTLTQLSVIPPASGGIDVGICGRVVDNTGYVFLDVSKVSSTNISCRVFQKTAGVSGGAFTSLTSLVQVSNNLTDTIMVRLQFTSASAGEAFANTPFLSNVWTSLGTFTGLNSALQTPTRYGMVSNNSGNVRLDDFSTVNPANRVTGTVSESFSIATTETAFPRVVGTVGTTLAITTSQTAFPRVVGTVGAALPFTATPTAFPRVVGTVARTLTLTGAGTGVRTTHGTVADVLTFTGQTTGDATAPALGIPGNAHGPLGSLPGRVLA